MTGLPNIDPREVEERGKDIDAKRALFLEAKELIDEKGVFMLAVRALRIRWYRDHLDTADRDKDRELKAKLQCLDAIPSEIQRYVSDYTMAMNKAKR